MSARLTLPSRRRFPTPQTRSSRASRISTAPRAFLKGIFGGGGSDADVADADATPKIATGEKQIVTVKLRRPMGMVLEPADGEKRGAIVAELVEGGNAEATGMIEVGDVLLSCAFDADECALGDRWYESVMDELAGSPECETVTLTLERVLLEDDNDMLSQTADAKRYWDEKRAAKAKMPTTLRRTPGVEPADIFVDVRGGPLGSGNFGTVFRGTFKGDQAVVLKNAKSDVLAAEELLECEMEMNYHVHANARGTCARFMGCIELGPKDGGELYNGTLTEGLWLMWANEGEATVESLMRDGTAALARATGCEGADELGVTRKAMRELLESLARLHACGVVHRDVKPANLIAAEKDGGVLKLIDLGSAALCLGDAPLLNYYPGVGPADPRYCKPGELYLLPEGSPRPTEANAEKLWRAHAPDRFDSFSAGCTMMQLAVVGLREEAQLATFLEELESAGFELARWRSGAGASRGLDFAALDANGDAGWDLAAGLLAKERAERTSCEAALQHPFFG